MMLDAGELALPIDPCANVSCGVHSTCQASSEADGAEAGSGLSGHRCACQSGFTGQPPDCVEIDECQSGPCRNNGTCTDLTNGYLCTCADGFAGSDCQTEVDECAERSP
jgi:hypothetical protein